MLAQNGALADLIASGARILESGCGPCIGMGQAPASHAVSLRTFNRNFYGRCGTLSAQVYLCSPETAAYSAISGTLVSPLQATTFEHPSFPHQFEVLDNSIILETYIPNEIDEYGNFNAEEIEHASAIIAWYRYKAYLAKYKMNEY